MRRLQLSNLLYEHSFILLTCAECDDSLLFSGASSIPLCYIPFPSTLFHQLFFHSPSLHLAIHFLVYLSALLFPNSYIICGDKMPTRCNRGFYCRSYCLLNMFRAPLCPSSGAQEYYTVVAACGISCCGLQVAGLLWSWGLCVRFASCKYHRQQPLYNTLELLMMGIVVP